jgi:hypothetical protein
MMVEVEWWILLAIFRACSPLGLVGECLDVNLRSGGALRGKQRTVGWEWWRV